jgi:hypothetical protein
MSQDLKEKREHLEALETFIKSPAHIGYVTAISCEIREISDSILAITPDTLMDYAEEMQLRGELRCLKQSLTKFEDARVSLKDRIDEIAEAELQNANIVK